MKKYYLLLIILFGSLLRLWRIWEFPALNADEAALGYNAYSILETARDEHGNILPIHFQSFNDFKPGLYVYLTAPFIYLFGLNIWAVRMPGVFAGIVSIYLVYRLIKDLFKDDTFALTASFLLAFSPWHIHFSRGAWEANVATLLIVFGVFSFYKAGQRGIYYYLSIFSFVMSLYAYHAARIISPLLFLGLTYFNRKQVKESFKHFFAAGLFGFIVFIPLLASLFSGEALTSRAYGVGLFSDPGPFSRINEQRGEHGDYTGVVAKAFHNKPVNYGLAFVSNWLEHYWGEFLFLSGDEIQRNRVPETGQLYIFESVFILASFYFIFREKKFRFFGFFIYWLLIAPIPAALTFQSPHALRALNMVIPITLFSSYGLVRLYKMFSKYRLIFVALFLWGISRYLIMYWIHMAKEYPFSSQYGMAELVTFLDKEAKDVKRIVVTDRYDQPYILFLFYLKYPAEKFQEEHGLSPQDKYGFSTVRSFDKYYFMPINYDLVQPAYPDSIIVGTDGEIPDHANIIKRINFPSGDVAFEVVAN